jgi:hypothetical protein
MVRTTKQMLACFVSENQDDWDTKLLYLQFAYNTAVHASTKQSPFEMTFGCLPKMPLDIICHNEESRFIENFDTVEAFRQLNNGQLTDPSKILGVYNEQMPTIALEYVTELKERLGTTFAVATKSRDIAVDRYKFNHDRRLHPIKYEKNELVLTDQPQLIVGRTKGLAHKFFGPFVILECRDNHTYMVRLAHKRRARRFVVHHNRLKRYFGAISRLVEPELDESMIQTQTPQLLMNRASRQKRQYRKKPTCNRWAPNKNANHNENSSPSDTVIVNQTPETIVADVVVHPNVSSSGAAPNQDVSSHDESSNQDISSNQDASFVPNAHHRRRILEAKSDKSEQPRRSARNAGKTVKYANHSN